MKNEERRIYILYTVLKYAFCDVILSAHFLRKPHSIMTNCKFVIGSVSEESPTRTGRCFTPFSMTA